MAHCQPPVGAPGICAWPWLFPIFGWRHAYQNYRWHKARLSTYSVIASGIPKNHDRLERWAESDKTKCIRDKCQGQPWDSKNQFHKSKMGEGRGRVRQNPRIQIWKGPQHPYPETRLHLDTPNWCPSTFAGKYLVSEDPTASWKQPSVWQTLEGFSGMQEDVVAPKVNMILGCIKRSDVPLLPCSA